MHERIHGDPTVLSHIMVHVLDWSTEALLDETPWDVATHRIWPYRLCIVPSYDATSADGCLGIVMAAEGCSLREMFDLVPWSHRTVCQQLVPRRAWNRWRKELQKYTQKHNQICSNHGLQEFENVYESFRRMEDEEDSELGKIRAHRIPP